MRRLAAPAAAFAALTLFAGVAAAHPPGVDDEGTPDPQPRKPDLEADPALTADATAPLLAKKPPKLLPYYPWAPIPPGYELKMGVVRKSLLYGGVITFAVSGLAGVAAAIAVSSACTTCRGHSPVLALPIAGPFIAFGIHGKDDPNAVYPAIGAVQIVGLAMLLTSATIEDQRLVRIDRPREQRETSWSIVPALGPGLAGLSFRGTM